MHSVVQGLISNPVRRQDAVEPRQCQEGVKSAQLENQALKERLHTIEEQNKVLSTNTAQYATTGLQEITTLAELYDTFPQHLHYLVPMNCFSHVFSKLLGITGKASKLYPLFPPMLFPGNIIDYSHKTLFGNWQPIAKGSAPSNAVKWSVTVVTPGTVAWAIVTGKTSRINYGTVFAFFKELLICDWEKPHLKGVIKNINNFIFEHTSCPSHDLNIRDSTEDLEEEMCLTQLGLAAEAGDLEDMSDHEEYKGDNNGASIDVLTEATGTITIRDPDKVPVPEPMISTTDTMTSALTVSSNSTVITGSSPHVYDGPGDETEVVAIEETNIQSVKPKSKAG
ncbi:hypothetical protein BDR06DRAFT_975917 [Suillus hirtellus]|nr:hypothetical protein BDR06DRAFT_975917 [Suillus hirtellus]